MTPHSQIVAVTLAWSEVGLRRHPAKCAYRRLRIYTADKAENHPVWSYASSQLGVICKVSQMYCVKRCGLLDSKLTFEWPFFFALCQIRPFLHMASNIYSSSHTSVPQCRLLLPFICTPLWIHTCPLCSIKPVVCYNPIPCHWKAKALSYWDFLTDAEFLRPTVWI